MRPKKSFGVGLPRGGLIKGLTNYSKLILCLSVFYYFIIFLQANF